MPLRLGFRILVIAASSLLVAGCHVPTRNTGTRQESPAARATKARGASEDPVAPDPGVAATSRTEKELIEAHAHYAQAVIHELNNDQEHALKEYYEAARSDLANEALTLEVSRRLLQARQTEKAQELLIQATARPGASDVLYAQLGFVYSRLGKPDLAVSASRVAIKKQPRSLDGYRNLFVTYLQNQKPQEALNVLEEAGKVPAVGPEFLIGLAELYGNLSLQVPAQKETARTRGRAVLQRAGKMSFTDPQLRLRLADANNLLGNDAEAARLYQDLLRRLPDVPFVRENVRAKLADIYLRESDHPHAIEQLESILKDNPTDTQAYYFLGSIAYDDRKYAAAAEYFGKVLLLDPESEHAYYDLAGAQLGQEKPGEALATLEKARQKFARNFLLEHLTALACSGAKDYTNAMRHFTAADIIARSTDPRRLTESFYFQFGAACERAGDYAQSEQCFEKCLELAPNFSEAQNYLGYMWADRGEKLDRARDLIEKALKAEPKNAAYLDSMGWVLFKLRQPQAALGYLLDAIRNSQEKDATLFDHLGDVYAALKQPDKAREAWRQSLAVEANEAVRKKLEAPAE